MSVTIKSNSRAAANLKYAVRDNLLKTFATTSNNVDGIQLFSFDDLFSFGNQATPVNSDQIKNLASGNADLTYLIAANSAGTLEWDNTRKAIDFSSVGIGINGVQTNDGWLANEFNGKNKYFILSAYVFIPTPENWHAKSGGQVDFVGSITSADPAQQTEAMGAIAFVHHPAETNEYQIWAMYSTAEDASGSKSSVKYTTIGTNSDFPFGMFAQISLVRDSTGTYLYIVSAKGIIKIKSSNTSITGKDVTGYGSKITWGRGRAYTGSLVNKYKISRGFIINLNKNPISDVQAFLKADWDRQVARGWIV